MNLSVVLQTSALFWFRTVFVQIALPSAADLVLSRTAGEQMPDQQCGHLCDDSGSIVEIGGVMIESGLSIILATPGVMEATASGRCTRKKGPEFTGSKLSCPCLQDDGRGCS